MRTTRTLKAGIVTAFCLVAATCARGAEPATSDDSLVVNGSFEELAEQDPARPADWYYLQQGHVVTDSGAPEGRRYLRFANDVPGRSALAQQHFKLNGRDVRALDVAVEVALRGVAPGQSLAERPAVRLYFYDADDAEIGQAMLGPWAGTQPWGSEATRVVVPAKTELLLVVIGLGGATGVADFDRLTIVPATINPSALPAGRAGGRQ